MSVSSIFIIYFHIVDILLRVIRCIEPLQASINRSSAPSFRYGESSQASSIGAPSFALPPSGAGGILSSSSDSSDSEESVDNGDDEDIPTSVGSKKTIFKNFKV